MIIGIDHGYYAIKSRNFSFPAGVTAYTHEPYTLKNTLQIGGKYFACGTGRQPIDLSGSAIGYHLIEFITMGKEVPLIPSSEHTPYGQIPNA